MWLQSMFITLVVCGSMILAEKINAESSIGSNTQQNCHEKNCHPRKKIYLKPKSIQMFKRRIAIWHNEKLLVAKTIYSDSQGVYVKENELGPLIAVVLKGDIAKNSPIRSSSQANKPLKENIFSHGVPKRRGYVCDVCRKVFSSRAELYDHIMYVHDEHDDHDYSND